MCKAAEAALEETKLKLAFEEKRLELERQRLETDRAREQERWQAERTRNDACMYALILISKRLSHVGCSYASVVAIGRLSWERVKVAF